MLDGQNWRDVFGIVQPSSNFSDPEHFDFGPDQFLDSGPSTNFTSGFAGLAISNVIKDFNQYSTSNSINQASFGKGPLGHAFDSGFYARQQADHDTLYNNLSGEAVALGSAFGPEGLGLGVLAAGVIHEIGQFTEPSVNETPTNSGTSVPFANGNVGMDNSNVQNVDDGN